MDPWSKLAYSRIIREASMVEEKLPEVNPPSGRVPGRGMLALPILEARWRNRGEIAKKGSLFGCFASWRIYRRRGAAGGATGGLGAPWRDQALGRARWPPGSLVVALWTHFGDSGSFRCADFLSVFPIFWSIFNMGET